MTKNTVEGLVRMLLAIVAGALLYDWRGAVASFIILFIITGLVQDHVDAMATIAKRAKGK